MSSSFIDNTPAVAYVTSDVRDTTPDVVTGGSSQDTIKVSHCQGLLIANKYVENQHEDCVDIVCVAHSTFDGFTLRPRGRNGITVKDRSRSVYFVGLSFLSHGKECDVELGQFSNAWYPGAQPTSDILLAGPGSLDGLPVKIRLWDATDPEVSFPHVIQRVPKWVWFPYFCSRYALLRITNFVRRLRNQTLVDTTPYLSGTLQRA
jgi:hypothetical protein